MCVIFILINFTFCFITFCFIMFFGHQQYLTGLYPDSSGKFLGGGGARLPQRIATILGGGCLATTTKRAVFGDTKLFQIGHCLAMGSDEHFLD